MEILTMPFLLPLLLLPLSLYLIFSIHKKCSGNLKKLPPGSTGWPILGENIELALSGLPKFMKHKMERYSHNVFKTSVLGERFVIFCGAQGNKFVFGNENKLVRPWLPVSVQKLMLPDFNETSHKGSTSLFRNFQYDTLKPEALREYTLVMDSLAREQLENHWKTPNATVKVLPLVKKYTFDLSCVLFMNVTDPSSVSKLLDPFTVLSNGLLSLPIDLPGTAFNRAIKASKTMLDVMLVIIKERRKEKDGNDLLSKMLTLTDEDGEYVSDEKMSNFFLGLIMASFDTTASALTAVIYFLAQLPHVYERVLEEQMAIAKSKKNPDEGLTWEDFEKMNYSKNVVSESLRLAPPAQGGFREATAEFDYAGFTIPKGWKVMWSPHSSHNNTDYFPEPEKFDPSRFEGSGPVPYAFVPFGGGPTLCPGRNYAKLAILVFIHNLVTRFRLEKAIPNEKMLFDGAWPSPAHGLPLRLLPHQD